jgi:hypothetical protein
LEVGLSQGCNDVFKAKNVNIESRNPWPGLPQNEHKKGIDPLPLNKKPAIFQLDMISIRVRG